MATAPGPEYTCAVCKGTFTETVSDREAQEELWRWIYGDIPIDWPWLRAFVAEHCVQVCDGCYPYVLAANPQGGRPLFRQH